MRLHKLTATNFMPYKGQAVVDFPTDETANVMIVFGDNMRGKTSLLNALRWGFYGHAVGRHSRAIPLQDIINKDATFEDDWRVEVFIQFDANGHSYDLRRSATRRPHIATPNKPEDFLVTVHLSRDGSPLTRDQVEPEIDQFAPEQISRFFLFDGELLQEYESLLIEGSDQGRQIKEAIEQVLGVPSLIQGRTELGAIVRSATKKQSGEIAHMHGLEKQAARQEELTAKQDAQERDLKILTDKLTDVRTKRTGLEDELEAAATIISAKGRLDILLGQQKSFTDSRERKRTERQVLLGQAWKDLLEIKVSTKRRFLQSRQTELTNGLHRQGRLNAEVSNLQKLLKTSECPTCGQTLSSERRAGIGAALGKVEVELSKFDNESTELEAVSAQIVALGKIRGVNARERLIEIDRDSKSAEVNLQRTENEIEKLNLEIEGYDTAELARKRILKDDALREEGRLENEIKSVRRDIEKTKEDLAIAQKAIQGLAPARSHRSTQKVEIATQLEKTFSVSIDRLRDKLRARVGELANEAFRQMTTQKGYRGLEINSNYGLSIIDDAGRKVPLRSAGAEQIVALSLIDGLNRTGRAIGPVVMDTPFGRLDLKHRDNILTYLPTVTSQFILLVHSGEIRPDSDLAAIKSRIGAVYTIREVTPTQSRIERTTL
jgi:DNA sulfur modification protein DndD